jgi:hypothetical protein
MPNTQIEWLSAGSEAEKDFRCMVVGWQTVVQTLNATVLRFNSEFFEMSADPHQEMKLIAAKAMVVASLREIKLMLEKWQNRLYHRSALSEATKTLKKSLNPTLLTIDELKEVRNLAFHFGDPIQEPDVLLGLYEEIDAYDIEELNKMLRALIDLGFRMRQDALEAQARARG